MSENAIAARRTAHGIELPVHSKWGIVAFAAVLSVAFWIIDINVDLYLFGEEGTFFSQLLSPEPFEIYFRALVVSLIMVLGFVGQAAVSKARSSEFVVKQSESWTRAVLESVQTGIIVIDSDTHKIVDANPVAVSMFGALKSEIIGHVCHKFICPAEVGKCPVTDLGQTVSNMEKCLIDSDGACRPIMKSVTRVSIGGRDLIIDSFVDISERKAAEESLKLSRAQLVHAMDLAHIANWEFDVDTGIFTFDDRFYALYGTTAEFEGGNRMSADEYAKKLVHPEDVHLVASEVQEAMQASDPGYVSQVEHRIVRRDGEIRHIVVRFGITKDENGRTIKTHGANQDITERKNAEDALYRANAGLEARVNQTNEISKALIGDIGIQRAAGIIYESGWKIGLAESRGLRAAWHGDTKSFAEDFFERRSTAVSFQVNLKEFDAERHYARARMFPVDCILDDERAAEAEKAYAHGYVAAVLSVSLGKPVGLREGPKSGGNLAPSYEVETRPLEPYEIEAYRME